MDLLSKDKYYIWERTDEISGNHYMLKDKLIDWNGRLARIEWAINLTEKEQQKILSSRLKTRKGASGGDRRDGLCFDLEESMNVIVRRVGELYNADRSYMMRIDDEDGQTISMTNEWLAEGVAPR